MSSHPLRYHAFRDYLQRRYRRRIQKVPLDAGFGCPHRAGPDGRGGAGCIYCENAAFSPHGRHPPAPLEEQLAHGIRHGRERYGASGFIAYFQAYTNTLATLEVLRERYDVIRRFPEVVGLAVGTRPDCVDPSVLDLLAGYSADYEVWLELGLQSAHDATLERIRRGHTVEASLRAVREAATRPLLVCAHLILGLPGEGHAEMMETARQVAGLPLQGVKLHHCHVVHGTPLEEAYRAGAYRPMDSSTYIQYICDFLEHLPWAVTIHRLVGDAPRDLLVAPLWSRDKGRVLRGIQEELARRGSRQGLRA